MLELLLFVVYKGVQAFLVFTRVVPPPPQTPPRCTGILRVMILSQLAPQRLTVAPEAPMPLAGLLEEVAAAQAGDGQLVAGPQSVADSEEGGSGGGGLKFREPSISAAAQPAELGWEEQPSALAGVVDGEGGVMKEVSSLQDLTSLDGTYEEEGIGTDDSSSTGEEGDGKGSMIGVLLLLAWTVTSMLAGTWCCTADVVRCASCQVSRVPCLICPGCTLS